MIHRRRYRPVAQRINRRQFIGRAGVFAGAVALGPSILAACGGDDDDDSGGGGGGSDSIAISNWLGYMIRSVPGRLRGCDRNHAELRPKHQRQQRVLHEDPAQPVAG